MSSLKVDILGFDEATNYPIYRLDDQILTMLAIVKPKEQKLEFQIILNRLEVEPKIYSSTIINPVNPADTRFGLFSREEELVQIEHEIWHMLAVALMDSPAGQKIIEFFIKNAKNEGKKSHSYIAEKFTFALQNYFTNTPLFITTNWFLDKNPSELNALNLALDLILKSLLNYIFLNHNNASVTQNLIIEEVQTTALQIQELLWGGKSKSRRTGEELKTAKQSIIIQIPFNSKLGDFIESISNTPVESLKEFFSKFARQDLINENVLNLRDYYKYHGSFIKFKSFQKNTLEHLNKFYSSVNDEHSNITFDSIYTSPKIIPPQYIFFLSVPLFVFVTILIYLSISSLLKNQFKNPPPNPVNKTEIIR
jgi:hypothetical protein